jgi:sugar/nucleoside kinase (ribokinase family)
MSGYQQALHEIHTLLPAVDILLPSLAEAQQLTGLTVPEDCALALLDAGVHVVALKLGKEGCLIAARDGSFRVPGFAVQTRDSTGAGDFFAAGLIAGFLGRLDWHSAAVLGNAMGAMAVTRVGAGAAAPKAQEVLSLLREQHNESSQRGRAEVIQRVIDFVATLATKPEEEGRSWWK